MSALRFDIAALERDLSDILAAYPELAEDESLRADMLEGSTDFREVLGRLVGMVRDEETLSAAIKERADALAKRKSGSDRRAEAYRALIFKLMQQAGERKVTLPEATLSISASPQSVQILDEGLIPTRFMKTTYSPLKADIKDALKAGQQVPGAVLSNGGERLSLRTV